MAKTRRTVSDYVKIGRWYMWGSYEESKGEGFVTLAKCVEAHKTRAYVEGVYARTGLNRHTEGLGYYQGWALVDPYCFDFGHIQEAIDAREVAAEDAAEAIAAWREEHAALLVKEEAEREAKKAKKLEEQRRADEARELFSLFEAAVLAMKVEEIRALRGRLVGLAVSVLEEV